MDTAVKRTGSFSDPSPAGEVLDGELDATELRVENWKDGVVEMTLSRFAIVLGLKA